MNKLKRAKLTLLVLLLVAACAPFKVTSNAAALHEQKTTQTVTAGVTYEEITRMYESGWTDIYVLRVDLTNPNVKLDVIESVTETGLRETVQELARSNGAIAAVNGDFFGGTALSSSMGVVIRDGKLAEARNYYNADGGTYAGLYIDKNNNPFIDFFKITHLKLLVNGSAKLDLDAKNKVTDMKRPVYIDRTAMTDTAKLDARFKDLYKVVVSDGRIVDISAGGAVKTVPENGFLVVMNDKTAQEKLKEFAVGDAVTYEEYSSFMGAQRNKGDIKLGITGGGKIIENGQFKENGLLIEPGKRHPRTAVGINQARTELIFVAIDGRSGESMGATHYETYEIMKSLGAHDAFHLDGGGSTTLLARDEGRTEPAVKNVPSEGAQRKVANAIGISSNSPVGSPVGLYVYANNVREQYTCLAGQTVQISAVGYDANYNPVSIPYANLAQSGTVGTLDNGRFTPQMAGETYITAEAGGVSGVISIRALSPATGIRITPQSFSAELGETVQLKAEIINEDGYGVDVTSLSSVWGVSGNIGIMEGSTFRATGNGTGSVFASYGGLTGSASVAVGGYTQNLIDFETQDTITYLPESVSGSAAYTNTVAHSGAHSLQINYTFKENTASSQTAAVDFRNASALITEPPKAFAFHMTGDAAGSSVSAVFTDGTGKEHLFGFPIKMDTGDWKYYYGKFPDNLPLPVSLSFVTITAAPNLSAPVNGKVYLDTIHIAYGNKPENTKGALYADYMQGSFFGPPQAGETELAVFGPTAHMSGIVETAVFERAIAKMQQNSSMALFAGFTAELPQMVTQTLKWQDAYGITDTANARIITLASSKGGLRATNAAQWSKLKNDLNASQSKNIIIVLNKDLWDNSYGFSDNKERDLLHNTLSEYKSQTGANIMVVAGISPQTKGTVRDGVRYITLNGLVTDGTASGYNILRIRVSGNTMQYDLEEI